MATLPKAGAVYHFAGITVTCKAVGGEAGGAYALFELVIPPGVAIPPHRHSREEESYYLVAGALDIRVGDTTVSATPGTFVRTPVGVVHAVKNTSDAPATLLALVVPAGLERLFAASDGLDPRTSADDQKRFVALRDEFGIEFVS